MLYQLSYSRIARRSASRSWALPAVATDFWKASNGPFTYQYIKLSLVMPPFRVRHSRENLTREFRLVARPNYLHIPNFIYPRALESKTRLSRELHPGLKMPPLRGWANVIENWRLRNAFIVRRSWTSWAVAPIAICGVRWNIHPLILCKPKTA